MASNPSLVIGDLVYLFCDQNKSRGRDRYLVVSVDGAWCQLKKFISSLLRSTSYRVKNIECFKVPLDASPSLPHNSGSARFETDDDEDPSVSSPSSLRILGQPLLLPHLTNARPWSSYFLPPHHRYLLLFLHVLTQLQERPLQIQASPITVSW